MTVPGRDGALGIQKSSPPLLTELKPGVVRVDYNDSTASQEFFVPGGFAFKHANNVVDVSAPEGVKLDSVDQDALRAANAEATKALAAATLGSKAHAEAKIQLELYKVRFLDPALLLSLWPFSFSYALTPTPFNTHVLFFTGLGERFEDPAINYI